MSSVPKFGTLGMKQKRERKRAMQLYDTQLENGLPVLVKEQEIWGANFGTCLFQ